MILIASLHSNIARSADYESLEIKVKAAYLYNFLRFVDWPEEHPTHANICVYGINENYRSAFSSMATLSKKSQRITINMFPEDDDITKLSACQIIFITDSATHKSKAIFEQIKDHQSLTVGESDSFISNGGMVNFVRIKDKIRFEINHDVAKAAGLKISSKVLRIAERVINSEDT